MGNYEGSSLSKILRVLGVIYLIGAIILAVIVFWQFGLVEADGFYSSHRELNIEILAIAIGVILQGIFVSCLALGLGRVIDRCDEIVYKMYYSGEGTGKTRYLRCKSCGELNEDTGYTRRCKKCDAVLTNADVVEM